GDGALRAVHSFPTRRSSDLVPLESLLGDDGVLAELLGSEGIVAGLLNNVLGSGVLENPLSGAGLLDSLLGEEGLVNNLLGSLLEDRKSTRLNSSHVKISYAV